MKTAKGVLHTCLEACQTTPCFRREDTGSKTYPRKLANTLGALRSPGVIFSGLLAAMLLEFIVAGPAIAETPALSIVFNTNSLTSAAYDQRIGWEFTVQTNILVTAWGLFDNGRGEFFENHAVQLWTNSPAIGFPLQGAGYYGGDRFTSENGYAWANVNLITLNPGSYVITADYLKNSRDVFPVDVESFSTDPHIHFVQPRMGGVRSDFPVQVQAGLNFFAPNFEFVVAPRLGITQATNSIIITWPAEPSFFVLKGATAVKAWYWQAITDGISGNASNQTLTLPRDSVGTMQFFRLVWPDWPRGVNPRPCFSNSNFDEYQPSTAGGRPGL